MDEIHVLFLHNPTLKCLIGFNWFRIENLIPRNEPLYFVQIWLRVLWNNLREPCATNKQKIVLLDIGQLNTSFILD